MGRKVTYDLAFKLKCVNLVVEHHYSCCSVSKKENIDESMIRRWVDSYHHYGLLGLEPRKNQSYSIDFKLKVLKEIEENHLTLRESRLKFNIPTNSLIMEWQKKFTTFGVQGLETKSRGRPKSMSNYKRKKRKSDQPLTREEELLLENERLRAEVDFLKKFNALIQAEEDKLKSRKHKPLKN